MGVERNLGLTMFRCVFFSQWERLGLLKIRCDESLNIQKKENMTNKIRVPRKEERVRSNG